MAHPLWMVLLALTLGVAQDSPLVGNKSSYQERIGPSSPKFARTLHELQSADYSDRMNATSWTADNPTLDRFYARKAIAVERLIGRLEAGKSVAPAEVTGALDTSLARRFGGW